MKKVKLPKCLAVVILLITAACSKEANVTKEPIELFGITGQTLSGQPQNAVARNGDTILNVTYENGTISSGITNLNGSDATAADAAYLVSQGANNTNYALAHKVIHGNSAYFSHNSYRSETSTVNVTRFYPGEKRRYEFSLLLKDWPDWNPAQPATQSCIFQCRVTGDNYVPVMIRLQRNTIQLRRVDHTAATILSDYRQYVNQWVHFRIDVLWTMDNTGYIKSYTKLPGQADYTLSSQLNNIRTFTGNTSPTAEGGKFGYTKWGVYNVPTGITGIAYHDDVRIIKLP